MTKVPQQFGVRSGIAARCRPDWNQRGHPTWCHHNPHLKISFAYGPLPYRVSCLAITSAVNKPYVALVSAYNVRIRGKVQGMHV